MSFAGAPAAAAGTRGDDNAGEDDQAASVLGVQTEPQVAVRSGDQAQQQSLQAFVGEQVALLINVSFTSEIITSQVYRFTSSKIALSITSLNTI